MSTVAHEPRAALRACWHPVAYTVAAAHRTTLLGESQRPDRVPFDLTVELHLAFDALAVAYRRAMRAHGLG